MLPSPTIAAIATGPSAGGVGIIRLSGTNALTIARRIAKEVPPDPEPRHAYFAEFVDAEGGVLDQGLFLYFRAPHSYTGEDVVELQAHGGIRLLELLLQRALEGGEARLAEPGEFTRRAFLNGRLDLARAEAVADLVAAGSEAAVRAAASQIRGALSERIRAVRQPLLELQADLEGVLSFPDEAEGAEEHAAERLEEIRFAMNALIASAREGRLFRRGAKVVLFGPVNAGKSTLFNALLGEERALVDADPGTTRDVLEARWELERLGITLFDTAGLREQAGRIEAMGIERARAVIAGADLAILVTPPRIADEERAAWRREAGEAPLVEVRTMADLEVADVGANRLAERASLHQPSALKVSGRTGDGVDELRREISKRLLGEGTSDGVWVTHERHREALVRASESVERALSALRSSTLEVTAGEVGLAVEALGEVTGENAPEALLDQIFQRFCIGK